MTILIQINVPSTVELSKINLMVQLNHARYSPYMNVGQKLAVLNFSLPPHSLNVKMLLAQGYDILQIHSEFL